MGCLLIILTGLAPRLAAVLYWIFRPERWDRAFDGSWLWPLLGVLFLPVTTIVWVLVSPGGVASFDFLWLGIAVFLISARRPDRPPSATHSSAPAFPSAFAEPGVLVASVAERLCYGSCRIGTG